MDLEMLLHLGLAVVAYALGAAAALCAPRLFGVGFDANHPAFLVLMLPVVTTVVAEAVTGLWRGTPGALGLGSLNVVLPLCVAGLVAGIAVVVAQRFLAPFEFRFSRDAESLTAWVVVAFACSGVALALWRAWPAPRARLW